MALDEVLQRLEKEVPRAARVVDISVRTVWRDWNYAKAWLRDAMVEKDQELLRKD